MTATSSSHASTASSLLRRLDARMLDHSNDEIGWEVFSLVYKVDAPVDTIVDPKAMLQYQRLFNHLWKMKRVEAELARGWRLISRAKREYAKQLPRESSDIESVARATHSHPNVLPRSSPFLCSL